ncbi:hypothetical protein BDM02DRAFT_3120315 [Thelephora ganbajun]|uniref:Uncharacterized protein n=1 Tax=Thelephora ganbajun TaxID=370292 RepID=A0ACB6Z754_THEGA|nr:hypothetical protein BDM02DRAFT_3120315 [Thelephora ganbajun]
MCARYIVDLQNPPTRLRRLVVRSIELIDHQEYEKVRAVSFVRLLNRLDVGVGMDSRSEWTGILLRRGITSRSRAGSCWWNLVSGATGTAKIFPTRPTDHNISPGCPRVG